jgi:hypothetical protein
MPELPPLPLAPWEPTKDTLHLWAQVLGKIRLASSPWRNHWWHAPFYVSPRGLTTGRLRWEAVSFDMELDFLAHRLRVRTDRDEVRELPLRDGLSVAAFFSQVTDMLGALGIRPAVRAEPFGLPITTPFPDDTEHASYDAEAVLRYWRALEWVDAVLAEFAGWFTGKQSPVHVFWHSFDLALTRFSGRRVPPPPEADPVTREAYGEEVVSFGFWAGDATVREPSFYSYTAPEPPGLTERPLEPEAARWAPEGGMALLPYDAVREAPDPRRALLRFLQAAYEAGAQAAGWDRERLASSAFPAGWAAVGAK